MNDVSVRQPKKIVNKNIQIWCMHKDWCMDNPAIGFAKFTSKNPSPQRKTIGQ